MKDVHPERNIFTFDSNFVISSDFDSGNLQFAEQAPDLKQFDPTTVPAPSSSESSSKGKKKKKKTTKAKQDSDVDETFYDQPNSANSASDQDNTSASNMA